MQMLFGAMLIDALHAAFEDAEIAFDCVGCYIAAHVFVVLVNNRFMAGVLEAYLLINLALIGH